MRADTVALNLRFPGVVFLALAGLASCGEPESPLTGAWQGRRFGSDVWNMTINDAHGSISGTYRIQWAETPPEIGGAISGTRLDSGVSIEFRVQIEAGMAMCRYDATLQQDDVLLSGETVCRLADSTEFQVGHLGMRKGT